MTEFRRVTDAFSIAAQLGLDDVSRAAGAGYKLLINNRPDGEAPDQPTSAEVAAAAEEAGMAYAYIPISGPPSPPQAEAMHEAMEQAGGPALAYCRSGNRSICTWAVGEVLAGAPKAPVLAAAAQAGYDLRPLLG